MTQISDAIKALRKEGPIGIPLAEQYLHFGLDVGASFYIIAAALLPKAPSPI